MVRRLLAVLSVPALMAASLSGVTAASASSVPIFKVKAPTAFSPDGDGVQDRVPVSVTLPHAASKVVVDVVRYYGGAKVVRTTTFRNQPAGVSTWTWDGRSTAGNKLPDGPYILEARAEYPDPGISTPVRTDVVLLDTELDVDLDAPTYGVVDDEATYRVYPRSTAVTDALPLTARTDEGAVKTLRLDIRNRAGRTIRSFDVNEPIPGSGSNIPDGYGGVRPFLSRGRTVGWTARAGGGPLPTGRYTAVVVGRDRAGNTARSETLRIFVSKEKLVWKDQSTSVAPADSTISECDVFPGDKCGGDYPPCGEVVASTQFPGGLSYHSGVARPTCGGDRASALHLLRVPAAAVRGIDEARVSFAGAPTNAGEADTGTLRLIEGSPLLEEEPRVTGTSGTTAWSSNPWLQEGASPQEGPTTPPSVAWLFETTGGNWVDVASFTVDYRYLVIDD